jgi:DNA-binding beta-propeller fold protein YncE
MKMRGSRRWQARASLASVVLAMLGLCGAGWAPAASATSYSPQESLGFSGLQSPFDVAVTRTGAVFVANSGGGSSETGQILKLSTQGVQTALPLAGLRYPQGVAVDSSGNVFVANTEGGSARTGQILELSPGPDGQLSDGIQKTLPFTGLNLPTAVAVDSSGDVFVSDFSGGPTSGGKILELSPGPDGKLKDGTETILPFTGIDHPEGLAVDSSGDVIVANAGGGEGGLGEVLELSPGAYGQSSDDTQTVLPFTGLNNPCGVAVDSSGDVIVANTDGNSYQGEIDELAPDGTQTVLPFSSLDQPDGLAVDPTHDVYVVNASGGSSHDGEVDRLPANTTPVSAANSTISHTPKSVPADGTSAATITVQANDVNGNPEPTGGATVTMRTSLGTISPVTDDNNGTYTATLTSATTGQAIVHATINGASLTAQTTVTFTTPPVYGSQMTLPFTNLEQPSGVAVDPSGDVFIANTDGGSSDIGEIDELTPGGTQTALAFTGLNYPFGVALDAAGDVFVANTGGGSSGIGEIDELTPAGTQTTLPFTGLYAPKAVAVDAAGDVFVANTGGGGAGSPGHGEIDELTPGGTQTVVPFTGLDDPYGVAVDSAGDVFVANTDGGSSNAGDVLKLSPDGTQTTLPFTGLDQPHSVAVDGSGNVYVSNSYGGSAGTGEIDKLSPNGTQTTLPFTGLNIPWSIAVDPTGDVFAANSQGGPSQTGEIDELPLVGPVTASASTITATPAKVPADGTSTATITVQATDANGRDEPTGGDTVTIKTTLGTLSPVTDNNDGTYTATLTSTTTGQAVLHAKINGSGLIAEATVTFTKPPAGAGAQAPGSSTSSNQ